MSPRDRRIPLAPLFFVSLASIAYEIFLSRYFAVASWSEYGYWVISIAMVGYSASGVFLSLFRPAFVRREAFWRRHLPWMLMLTAVAGFARVAVNPFNPLELQNPELWSGQLLHIGAYYLALFPFFFLSGLYVGLCFVLGEDETPLVYTADLVGAGVGGLVIVAAMYLVHPFHLLLIILPCLFLAALAAALPAKKGRAAALIPSTLALIVGIAWVLMGNRADFNQYKAIYAPLHVQGNIQRRTIISPRGLFSILDNFTERRDLDLSNNYDTLGVSGPPRALGFYRDGNRVTSLVKKGEAVDYSYLKAALGTFPYTAREKPSVLLVGSGGGARRDELERLGAGAVTILEPDPTIYGLLTGDAGAGSRLVRASPRDYLARGPQTFSLIEISPEFLDANDVNRYTYTVESFRRLYRALAPGGLLMVPVSIREFTFYTVKLLETARRALATEGVVDPSRQLVVYRSAWSAMILVRNGPFSEGETAQLLAFCDERSFDVSWYPGMKPGERPVWNDLPAISFETETSTSAEEARDSLAADIAALFGRVPGFLSGNFFNLEPASEDRPFFYSILRLSRLREILPRVPLLPREEISSLINLAVLLQAVLFAAAVLLLPLVRPAGFSACRGMIARGALYFAGLGLGYLCVEIVFIEKFTLLLNDRTSSFGLVLAGMLIFSGLGSLFAGRWLADPQRGARIGAAGALALLGVYVLALDPLLAALSGLAPAGKYLAVLLITAPPAFAMGFPFPLGLSLFHGERGSFLPWAWSINGAFSVVATPLANLLALTIGYRSVLILAAGCYLVSLIAFPADPARMRRCETA